MKKRNIGLCAVALFCMHNNAKAMEAFLKQDKPSCRKKQTLHV